MARAARRACTGTSGKSISIRLPSWQRALARPACTAREGTMKKRTRNLAIGAAVLTYAGLGFVGAKYIAGGLFVLANRQLPIGVTASTWSQNWEAYADDAKQRTRLKMSAAFGGGMV